MGGVSRMAARTEALISLPSRRAFKVSVTGDSQDLGARAPESPTGEEVGGTRPIRIVVVDDHSLFRRGVAEFVKAEGMRVVGEAANGEDGIRAIARFSPDVVVMDIHMPGISGIEATREVIARSPDARVLIFTVSGDDDDVLRAIAAGACGYLHKDAPMDELVEGIRTAAAGGSMISPRAAAPLLRELQSHVGETALDAALLPDLSERETEVLKLLMLGADNAQIGETLFVSTGTVKNHISAILEKLGVENRVQAAVMAVRAGLG